MYIVIEIYKLYKDVHSTHTPVNDIHKNIRIHTCIYVYMYVYTCLRNLRYIYIYICMCVFMLAAAGSGEELAVGSCATPSANY